MNAMRKNRKKCYLGNWRLLLSWINCMGPRNHHCAKVSLRVALYRKRRERTGHFDPAMRSWTILRL